MYVCAIYTCVQSHTHMHAILRPASVPACVCTHLPLGERNLQVSFDRSSARSSDVVYHRPDCMAHIGGPCLASNPNPECVYLKPYTHGSAGPECAVLGTQTS